MEQKIAVQLDKIPKIIYYQFNKDIKIGENVVIESNFGQEIAIVKKIEKLKEKNLPLIIRIATEKDLKVDENNKKKAKENLEIAKNTAKKLKLNIKIFDCKITLDKKKLIFYFTAESRVDFRELVKSLANIFKTRIELHQVGVRDEIQRTKSMGICGKECCCGAFLGDFNHVTIKMAKQQGLSLLPSNITGACGKLLCCLEYENEMYADIIKQMPEVNSTIKTPDGVGQVMFNNFIKKTVEVKLKNSVKEYALNDIVKLNEKK